MPHAAPPKTAAARAPSLHRRLSDTQRQVGSVSWGSLLLTLGLVHTRALSLCPPSVSGGYEV